MNNISKKICLTLILLKTFDIHFCHYFATNIKIAITHLWHAMELQTICHLIAKDKEVEQYISRKNSNFNSFGVMSPLLKVAKIAITHLSLGLSPQNQRNFQGCENSLRQLIDKKSVAVAVLEKFEKFCCNFNFY